MGFCLLQRYPHLFRNMYLNNPMVNLFQMAFSTDLPEWAWNEGVNDGRPFDYARDFSEEQIL